MEELYSEIEIDAPAGVVWRLLADLDRYAEWNPFMQRAGGSLQAGKQIEVFLQPPSGMGMTIKPRLLEVQPGRGLRWLGHLGFPGLFDGEHILAIEPLDDGRVCFVQREQFQGILASLLLRWIGQSTLAGFEAMNRALKAEAESAGAANA